MDGCPFFLERKRVAINMLGLFFEYFWMIFRCSPLDGCNCTYFVHACQANWGGFWGGGMITFFGLAHMLLLFWNAGKQMQTARATCTWERSCDKHLPGGAVVWNMFCFHLFWPCLWKMGLIPHSIVHHVFWRRQPNWQTCLEDRFLGVSITGRIMHFFWGKDCFVFNQKSSARFLLDLRKQHPLRL